MKEADDKSKGRDQREGKPHFKKERDNNQLPMMLSEA